MTTRTAGGNRSVVPALAALTIAGAILRAVGLNGGMWVDEYTTVLSSLRLTIVQIVTTFPSNNHHPLFALMAHSSAVLFGEQPWSIRLPAFLFGVASIPLVYVFAKMVTSRLEAMLATTLFTVSYDHVWFSQNARGYTALLFWTMVCTWLLVRGVEGRSRRWHVAYGVSAALGAYTHLTMGFVVVAHLIWWLARARLDPSEGTRARRQQAVMAFGIAAAVTLVLYLPVVFQVNRFFAQSLSPFSRAATPIWAAQEVVRRVGLGAGTIGAALVGVLAAAGLIGYWRENRWTVALFVLPPLLVFAGILVMGRPTFPRFFFFALAFAILFVVRGAMIVGGRMAGTSNLAASRRGVAAGSLIVGVLIAASLTALIADSRYPKQDFEGVLRFLDAERQPGDKVVSAGPVGSVFKKYYRTQWASASELSTHAAAASPVRRVWVVHSFSNLMTQSRFSRQPYLTEPICRHVRTFRGTVGGGDIHVCVIENSTPPGTP